MVAQHRLQLACVTEGEPPRQRSHGRRGIHAIEERAYGAVAQDVDERHFVQDLAGPGDLHGIMRWHSEASSTETLPVYVNDDRIKRATEPIHLSGMITDHLLPAMR